MSSNCGSVLEVCVILFDCNCSVKSNRTCLDLIISLVVCVGPGSHTGRRQHLGLGSFACGFLVLALLAGQGRGRSGVLATLTLVALNFVTAQVMMAKKLTREELTEYFYEQVVERSERSGQNGIDECLSL